MISRKEYSDIIERCVLRNLPFVLYAAPDTNDYVFFTQRPDEQNECQADFNDPDWNGFFINFFNNDEPYIAGVAYDYDYDETLAELEYLENMDGLYMPADVMPSLKSTTPMQHSAAVRIAVEEIKQYDGKVVISQMTAVTSKRPLGDVMWEYFDRFPHTFRFLVFTPETGMWLGATPELLARCFTDRNLVISMALAGTKRTEEDELWDSKNVHEHFCVISHILDTFEDAGLKTDSTETDELQFGPVKHLCTYIMGEGKYDPAKLLYDLSPTPAVAGFPMRDHAVELISRLEKHQRYCYTGFVGIKSDNDIEAYVNLRSALVVPCLIDGEEGFLYNIYSGGGIMPQSKPADEWEEAMAKMAPLYQAVTGSHDAPRPEEIKETITFPDYVSRRDFLMQNRYAK